MNKPQYRILPLFPLNLIVSSFQFDPSPLIEELYKIKKLDPKGVVKSNEGGYQTQDNLQFNSTFLPLMDYIKDLIFSGTKKPSKILNMWGNISPQYCYNNAHNHTSIPSNNRMSGVAYLQVNKNSGPINFHNPLDICNTMPYVPVPKEVIIFPHDLVHSVDQNKSDQDRISIAFNLQIL